MAKTTTRAGQRGKGIEEVVAYALGHRIRVYVLTILNEGVYSPDQIARIIGEPLNTVSHHIRELHDAGSIELVTTEQVRNTTRHFYRAVEMPYYSDEETAAMTPQQRQVTIGLIIQCLTAEVMSSFWAGKMHSDPRICLSWRWYNVDQEGREAIADAQAEMLERVKEIEIEATNRRAHSGEEACSVVVAAMGFERQRTGPMVPGSADADYRAPLD